MSLFGRIFLKNFWTKNRHFSISRAFYTRHFTFQFWIRFLIQPLRKNGNFGVIQPTWPFFFYFGSCKLRQTHDCIHENIFFKFFDNFEYSSKMCHFLACHLLISHSMMTKNPILVTKKSQDLSENLLNNFFPGSLSEWINLSFL